ncbi:MAG: NHL repeat-containing protein [Ignavibacteriales bacterium]|nr:NHL repeat-containing protein [Ignavibacteriales bacterium]
MATILAITWYFFSLPASRITPPDTVLQYEYSAGSFQHATRLAVSPQGWVYCIDEAENVVHVLKNRGRESSVIGGYGWATTSFDRPSGVATDGINVFISDHGNHRIQRFDKNLNYVSSLSTRDTSAAGARFGYPMSVAVSKSGDLFIVDGENLRIVRFSADSRYLQTFGSFDAAKGRLVQPGKIVLSNDDRIYVAEPDRIVEFDYFGNFVRTVGNGALSSLRSCAAVENGLLAVARDTLFWFSRSGMLALRTPLRFILADEQLSELQDVVVIRNLLYVLVPKRIFVFVIHVM